MTARRRGMRAAISSRMRKKAASVASLIRKANHASQDQPTPCSENGMKRRKPRLTTWPSTRLPAAWSSERPTLTRSPLTTAESARWAGDMTATTSPSTVPAWASPSARGGRGRPGMGEDVEADQDRKHAAGGGGHPGAAQDRRQGLEQGPDGPRHRGRDLEAAAVGRDQEAAQQDRHAPQ